jgi:hypothetical protein
MPTYIIFIFVQKPMELLLFEQDKFRRLYNCSRIDVDSVPLAQRQNVALGIFYAGIGLLEEVARSHLHKL